MKPFNITEAEQGKPVVTRDGRDAKILKTDLDSDSPVVAVIRSVGNFEQVFTFNKKGRRSDNVETRLDLFMQEDEPQLQNEAFVNIYYRSIPIPGSAPTMFADDEVYLSEKEAKDNIIQNLVLVTTAKVQLPNKH